MSIEEMIISFLHIISHHIKNMILKRRVARFGETISRQFHAMLNSILKLHSILLKKPDPMLENSTDEKWKWFKDCVSALDRTYIKVDVDLIDKHRYRIGKNEIATNVLGVYTSETQFIYVLPRWEDSAADCRVLKDAISRGNGLKVPKVTEHALGFYYLCDARNVNDEGFLAPYRGQRYHLNDWRQGHQPITP